MHIDLKNMNFTVEKQICMPFSRLQFNFIDYGAFLVKVGVKSTELLPFDELPTLAEANKMAANAGTSRISLDLGTSYGVSLAMRNIN